MSEPTVVTNKEFPTAYSVEIDGVHYIEFITNDARVKVSIKDKKILDVFYKDCTNNKFGGYDFEEHL